MCKPKVPKPEKLPGPAMFLPESTSEEVQRAKKNERKRAMAAFGRQSTVVAGSGAVPPTAQAKTALGA